MLRTGARVVAHVLGGTLIRGRNDDFRPGRESFTVITSADHPRVRVEVADLKALFFVKSLSGKPRHVQSNDFDDGPRVGRPVWVVFSDGEELAGRVLSVKEETGGFFLFPLDPESNLDRAWVVAANTKSILFDEEATEAAERYSPRAPDPATGSLVTGGAPDQWDEMLRRKSAGSPQAWDKSRPDAPSRTESDIFLGDW